MLKRRCVALQKLQIQIQSLESREERLASSTQSTPSSTPHSSPKQQRRYCTRACTHARAVFISCKHSWLWFVEAGSAVLDQTSARPAAAASTSESLQEEGPRAEARWSAGAPLGRDRWSTSPPRTWDQSHHPQVPDSVPAHTATLGLFQNSTFLLTFLKKMLFLGLIGVFYTRKQIKPVKGHFLI